MHNTDQSLARAEAAHYRAPDMKEPSQADLELEIVNQYNAIPAEDIPDILVNIEDTMAQVKHIGNAELMGRVVLKAMEVYAKRHAMGEVFGWGVEMPEIDKECAKLVAQWCLEQQGIKRGQLKDAMSAPSDASHYMAGGVL
jgi:hypothetical protein